jgi:hypothetical protein
MTQRVRYMRSLGLPDVSVGRATVPAKMKGTGSAGIATSAIGPGQMPPRKISSAVATRPMRRATTDGRLCWQVPASHLRFPKDRLGQQRLREPQAMGSA